MGFTAELKDRIIKGHAITKQEAMELWAQPLEELCDNADKIRRHFCGDAFDMCTIISGKGGRCSEDCSFCAQSACRVGHIDTFPLLPSKDIVTAAVRCFKKGIGRFSIVTSGRRLTPRELNELCGTVRKIKACTDISICASVGLLNREEFALLREAGVERIHNNLEASEGYFPHICTTHTFGDKVTAIRSAMEAGLTVCSGGIMGIGESQKDRVDMALTLRELGIKSVPVNMLNPVAGTPMEGRDILAPEEMKRIVAIYRFILPDAYIRLAGGRGLMEDKGRSCFRSGANATITGDMLTTSGISAEEDREILMEEGYNIKEWSN